MRIKELTIRNFRKIREMTIAFPAGLTVIIGQNNAGKTTIVDALRLMLFPGRDYPFRRREDRACLSIGRSRATRID